MMRSLKSDNKTGFNWKDQSGFTMIELIIAGALTLLIIAIMVGTLQNERIIFDRQTQNSELETAGIATKEFLSKSVMNSGYNVFRGKRFLAASDHYLSVVYDEDDDGTVQNDEVFIYAVSEASGSVTESFSVDAYFDQNDDGTVASDEHRTYSIELILNNPPYNLYKYTLNNGDSGYSKAVVARNVDNFILSYYDKNLKLLPRDGNDSSVDPTMPFNFSSSESQLNDIRRVDMELLVRSKNPDSKPEFLSSGSYTANSVATYGGDTSYSDSYHRKTFTAKISPRNLSLSPWGSISLVASPSSVTCPTSSTTVTANLVDNQGQAMSGETLTFTTNGGTLSPSSVTTGTGGSGGTSLTYDYSDSSKTITISSNTTVTVDGESRPIYNSIPVAFTLGVAAGDNIATEDFENAQGNTIPNWTEYGQTNWNISTSGTNVYHSAANGSGIAVYDGGCLSADYDAQVDLVGKNGSGMSDGDYSGLVIRHQGDDDQNHYRVQIYSSITGNGNNAVEELKLQVVKVEGGVETTLTPEATLNVELDSLKNTTHYLKVRAQGESIQAKFWVTGSSEPSDWNLTVSDSTFSSGKVGVATQTSVNRFDNVTITAL